MAERLPFAQQHFPSPPHLQHVADAALERLGQWLAVEGDAPLHPHVALCPGAADGQQRGLAAAVQCGAGRGRAGVGDCVLVSRHRCNCLKDRRVAQSFQAWQASATQARVHPTDKVEQRPPAAGSHQSQQLPRPRAAADAEQHLAMRAVTELATTAPAAAKAASADGAAQRRQGVEPLQQGAPLALAAALEEQRDVCRDAVDLNSDPLGLCSELGADGRGAAVAEQVYDKPGT